MKTAHRLMCIAALFALGGCSEGANYDGLVDREEPLESDSSFTANDEDLGQMEREDTTGSEDLISDSFVPIRFESSMPQWESDPSYLIALEHLLVSKTDAHYGWSAEAQITDRYPVYLPGRDAPSYFEYKVESPSASAGYILVYLDGAKPEVVEAHTSGDTVNERYREILADLEPASLRVYRLGMLASTARIRLADESERTVATIGIDGAFQPVRLDRLPTTSPFIAMVDEMEQTVALNLEEKIEALAPNSDLPNLEISSGQLTLAGLKERLVAEGSEMIFRGNHVVHFLKHKFANGTHLPPWWQPSVNGYPVGCGAVAWAQIFAYWSQFHGMWGLLEFNDINKFVDAYWEGSIVEDIMWTLARQERYLDTWHGKSMAGGFGASLPSNMLRGILWAKDKGYTDSHISVEDFNEYSMFNQVRESTQDDRPAILLINAHGIGAGTHYVGVEGTQRIYHSNPTQDRLGYLVNWGWGGYQTCFWCSETKAECDSACTANSCANSCYEETYNWDDNDYKTGRWCFYKCINTAGANAPSWIYDWENGGDPTRSILETYSIRVGSRIPYDAMLSNVTSMLL